MSVLCEKGKVTIRPCWDYTDLTFLGRFGSVNQIIKCIYLMTQELQFWGAYCRTTHKWHPVKQTGYFLIMYFWWECGKFMYGIEMWDKDEKLCKVDSWPSESGTSSQPSFPSTQEGWPEDYKLGLLCSQGTCHLSMTLFLTAFSVKVKFFMPGHFSLNPKAMTVTISHHLWRIS